MFEQTTTQIASRISELEKDKFLPQQLKRSQIESLRASVVQGHGTDTSFKVITSISNTMVGSSIIVYPILFVKDGMLGSLLVLLVIGVILFFTCRLLVVHNRKDQPEFSDSIKRILGPRWARLNALVNVTLLYIVSVAYFMLICSNFYAITSAILHQVNGFKPPPNGQLTFDTYSVQYASIICTIFTTPLLVKRDIDRLLSFFKFTIYLVFFYGFFILASFVRVLAEGILEFNKFVLFGSDFSTVAGAFALSFLIHPICAPILKRNVKQENNLRDLFLGYCLTALIYTFVGFVGGLTCAQSVEDIIGSPQKYNTVFDCVIKGDTASSLFFFIFGKIVQLGIFVQNLSVMPILSFMTRKELLDQFQDPITKAKVFNIYNICMGACCLSITFFQVDVSIVLSLNGAIVGFFMAYAIPIATHLTCYHRKLSHQQRAQRTQSLLSSQDNDQEIISEALRCNPHPPRSLLRHLVIYGGLFCIGIAIGFLKILNLFN